MRTIKTCRLCERSLPIENFARNGVSRRTGNILYRSYCQPCWNGYKQQRRAALAAGEPKRARHRAAPTHCRDCNVLLTTENRFTAGKSLYTGRVKWSNRCKVCWLTYQREYRKRIGMSPEENKANMLRWRYGLTLDEYTALANQQGGVCAICHQPNTCVDPRTGTVKLLAVDHDHATGAIRGLLCSDCNRGMGFLKDSQELLRRALEYLEAPPAVGVLGGANPT